MSDSINFAWYLMFWLRYIQQPEHVFWRTMTPARCAAIYAQYTRTHFPAPSHSAAASGGSLSQYLSGGG